MDRSELLGFALKDVSAFTKISTFKLSGARKAIEDLGKLTEDDSILEKFFTSSVHQDATENLLEKLLILNEAQFSQTILNNQEAILEVIRDFSDSQDGLELDTLNTFN